MVIGDKSVENKFEDRIQFLFFLYRRNCSKSRVQT